MSIQREQQSVSHGENVLGCLLRNGEYLVQSFLGRGGMGTVYLAFHTTLSLPLALKQLPADKPLPENVILELDALLHGDDATRHALLARDPGMAFPQSGGEFTDRFLREALLLARLQHPCIPTLYDYFFEHGSWYLVLDYLPGPTLGAYLHAHAPLPVLAALSYAMQLCEVLVYLQERVPSIVFRDLKPANVILLEDGSLMLIDFGSACYAGMEQAGESLDIGSPGYAAPEQYERAARVDMRSDFYSLGMLLYGMLTGNALSETTGESFPSSGSVSPVNGLKPLLRGLLRLATQPDPAQRFQSARAFYQALERAYRIEERRAYQEDMPTSAPPPVQMSQEPGEEVLPIVPPRSLDLAHRQQTRAALYNARYERLLHEQLEMQLASVDEGLQRRSSMSRSSESPIVTERPGRVVLPVHRLQRLIQVSFLLVLVVFVILTSLLINAHLQGQPDSPPVPGTQPVSVAATSSVPTVSPTVLTGHWQLLSSLPVPQADNTVVYVTLQGHAYVYMSGGYSGPTPPAYDRNLYRYDIAAARWENVTGKNFPGTVNNAAVTDDQGHIFFTGGYSSDTYRVVSLLYQYHLQDGTLQKIVPPAQMPLGFGGSMLADRQGHLYMTQGFMSAGDPQAQAGMGWYRYDIGSSRWHLLKPLPVGLGYAVLALDSSGNIVLLGGATDAGQNNQRSDIYRYDSVHDTWSLLAARTPQPLSGAVGCALWPDRILIAGGADTVRHAGSQRAWFFDQRTMQWTVLPSLPNGGSVLGVAACDSHGHAYVVRGASDPRFPTRDFLELSVPPGGP